MFLSDAVAPLSISTLVNLEFLNESQLTDSQKSVLASNCSSPSSTPASTEKLFEVSVELVLVSGSADC
ncbi:hypothetical protein BpHYR1_026580 [Brachionus plicatilis]|uniref:Uncharacterized protein n=1 Tax=Brachionus plicatilis TaxID=10195 RepID=A0A3M7RY64_BRAPC|nr:hypothetical protein BpHYR1_026580 [Brachionus plicatilis]